MKALEEIALLDLPDDSKQVFAKDMGLFSFLTCGIPYVDLAHLTCDNIIDGDLVYYRAKTGTLVRVRITDGMQRLIDKYADPDSPYLFPILPQDVEGEELYEAYKSALREYNSCLIMIGQLLSTPTQLK